MVTLILASGDSVREVTVSEDDALYEGWVAQQNGETILGERIS